LLGSWPIVSIVASIGTNEDCIGNDYNVILMYQCLYKIPAHTIRCTAVYQ
jgi:hypothetical protein